MSKRKISLVMIVLGLAVALVSLGADFIGIGSSPGIHSTQIIGIIIGVIIALIGFWLKLKKPK
jgi:hypothetical protein